MIPDIVSVRRDGFKMTQCLLLLIHEWAVTGSQYVAIGSVPTIYAWRSGPMFINSITN